MKKHIIAALALAIVGSVSVQAQDESAKPKPPTEGARQGRPGGPRGEGMRAQMLEKYDANKDGKLDESERETMRKEREAEMVKRFDKNGDGKLDDAEREAAREGAGRRGGRRGEGQGGGDRPAQPEKPKSDNKEKKD
jgi:hypothetical protein